MVLAGALLGRRCCGRVGGGGGGGGGGVGRVTIRYNRPLCGGCIYWSGWLWLFG